MEERNDKEIELSALDCEYDLTQLVEKIVKEQDSNNGYANLEEVHIKADDLLCDFLVKLGYTNIVDTYKKIPKWYA